MVNIIITILSTLLCLMLASIICRKRNYHFAARNNKRLGNIDGLRGYLALGVLFNHYLITYHWKIEGAWNQPPEYYFTTLGQSGVSIFFMITGYLFIYKLLSSSDINWKILYLSRLFRLIPLQLFVTLLVIVIVAYQSSFIAYDTPWKIFKDALHWIAIAFILCMASFSIWSFLLFFPIILHLIIGKHICC